MKKRHVPRLHVTEHIVFLIFFLLFLCITVLTSSAQPEEVRVEYFYEDGCLKCQQSYPIIEAVILRYDNINYTGYEIATSYKFMKEYGVYTVPAIVINKSIVIKYSDYGGDSTLLEYLLVEGIEKAPPIQVKDVVLSSDAAVPYELSPFIVLLAGLLAGFNPCLLAVMAFLASVTISSSGSRRDMLAIVGGFCAGIFTTYMIAGIGFLKTVSFVPETKGSIILFMSVLIGLLGVWHIYDAYSLRRHSVSTFRTPGSLVTFMSQMHGKNTLLLSFLAGGIFSLVKAPCVGAVYLSILDLLVTRVNLLEGAVYLLIYNLGVVLPVIVLGVLLAFGLSPETVMEFKEKRRSEIRFVTGVVLIVLALLLYFNVI
jgi:cytochrome c biogenesis protein CcdA